MITQRFPYYSVPPFSFGMPVVNVSLSHEGHSVVMPALVDSGAAMNLLPFECGQHLGFVWEEQRLPLPMGGLLSNAKAFAVSVTFSLDPFPPIDLAFAWTDVSHRQKSECCWGRSISFSFLKLMLS